MPSARTAASVFAVLTALVTIFQLALALGAPWGEFAMGGAFKGALPPAMRVAEIAQAAILILLAAIVLSRAGLILPGWRRAARVLIWVIVAVEVLATTLNLITPSPGERLIWAPVALLLLAASLRVALSREQRS